MEKGGNRWGESPPTHLSDTFPFVFFFSNPTTCFGSLFPFLHDDDVESCRFPKVSFAGRAVLATSLDIWEIALELVHFGLLAELFPAEFLCFAGLARNC